MNQTQAYMDQTDWVERYAWFGAMTKMPDGVNSVRTYECLACASLMSLSAGGCHHGLEREDQQSWTAVHWYDWYGNHICRYAPPVLPLQNCGIHSGGLCFPIRSALKNDLLAFGL